MDTQTIVDAIEAVTKLWTRQRKAEERDLAKRARRKTMYRSSAGVAINAAAYQIMPDAYMKASSGGTLPAHARQIMYAARGPIQEATGETFTSHYFTQTILPAYLRDHPGETADWDVVFDARGHLTEPHTGRVVPLGTLDVREYLRGTMQAEADAGVRTGRAEGTTLLTCGPERRYGAILFIEKEGFMPLFNRVRLAERYDLAIMSTKGQSVTASRLLVDMLCHEHDIPLLVLRDFDKAGFSIVNSFRRDSERYAYRNKIQVVDLGLRLADAEENGLESEEVPYITSARKTLAKIR